MEKDEGPKSYRSDRSARRKGIRQGRDKLGLYDDSKDLRSYKRSESKVDEKTSAPPSGRSASQSARRAKIEKNVNDIGTLTEEDKLRAMLGHTTTISGARAPYLWREDFCGACGCQHHHPELMDMYPFCTACFNTLREPNHLRERWRKIIDEQPLECLIATYGHVTDTYKVTDVTDQVRAMTKEFKTMDRISIKPSYDLSMPSRLGCDPAPGEPKQLRVRYRCGKVYGWVTFEINPDNHTPVPILFVAPKERHLTVLKATWGHPKGRSTTGRMSIDVLEQMQGLIDQHGGSYLILSTRQSMTRMLGDPCPKYPKDLALEYDIAGRVGHEVYHETHGHLKRPASIQTTPVISPLIWVQSATYGLTVSGQRERVHMVSKEIAKINAIEHRRSLGMLVQAHEVKHIKDKPALVDLKRRFKEMPIKFVDISEKMQAIADQKGAGGVLKLGKIFQPNMVFGNPHPGEIKLLECSLVCHGHDSERRTDSYEMTPSGYPRNVILGKESRFNIIAADGPDGKGILEEELVFETYNSSPLIVITNALYGHPSDLKRNIDVTTIVQEFVVGRKLHISKEVDLDALLTNPCPGVKKSLKVKYVTRGFQGAMRVREKNDCLSALLELGYPPIPPADEDIYA